MTRREAEKRAQRAVGRSGRAGATVVSWYDRANRRCWLALDNYLGDAIWLGIGSCWSVALKRFKEAL